MKIVFGLLLVMVGPAASAAEQRNLHCNVMENEKLIYSDDVNIGPQQLGTQINLAKPFIMVSVVPGTNQIGISFHVSEQATVVAKGSPTNDQKVSLEASLENGDQLKIECVSK